MVGTNNVTLSVVETNSCVDKGGIVIKNGGNGKKQKEKENAEIGHKRGTSKRKSNLNAKHVKDREYKKRQEKSDGQYESKSHFPTNGEPGTILDSSCKNTIPPSFLHGKLYVVLLRNYP
ncbi:hypothetical protein HN51_034531 [Arachis hypogaea]